MVSLFRTNTPLTILAGIFYSLLININLLGNLHLRDSPESGPISELFYNLLEYINLDSGVGLFIIYICILLIQAFQLNGIFLKHKVFPNRNYLALMAYITMMALFSKYSFMSPAFLSMTFLIAALEQIFMTDSQDMDVSHFFNAGFWTSMAALVYSPLVVLLIFLFFAFAILFGFYWRNWMAALVSAVIPYFLTFTYYFSIGSSDMFFNRINPFNSGFISWPHWDVNLWIQLGALLFLMIFSFILTGAKFFQGAIRVRKMFQVFTILIPTLLLIFIFINKGSIDVLILTLIPLSAYLAHSLGYMKSTLWPELVQLIFIASIVLIHFINI